MRVRLWNILICLVIVTRPLYCSTEWCSNRGDIRLQNGTNEFEGRVEVCGVRNSGNQTLVWKTVCNAGWDVNEAIVVCKQLGFSNILNSIPIADETFSNHRARHIDYIIKKNFTCQGDERTLLNCTYYNRNSSYCNESQLKPAGVYCFGQEQRHCRNSEIRLGNGTNNTSGRVEVCLGGLWGTVCDDGWDSNDATTVCRQLGYNHTMKRAIPTRGAYFGEGSGPIHLSRAQCSSEDTRLIDCTTDNTGLNKCKHSEDAGVICMGGSSCKDFDVRLIEGESEREGRVEICYNGVWGTVCADYGWDEVDVNIVCQQLGFSYQGTTSINNNHFGALILLGNVACNQNHSNLSQCVDLRSIGSYHDCEHTAGVICMDEDILVTNTQIQPTIFYASTTYTSHGSTYKSHDSNSTASVGSDSSTIALFGTGGALVIVIAIAVTEMVLIAMLVLRRKEVNCNGSHIQVNDNVAYGEVSHRTIKASTNESGDIGMEENVAYSQVPQRCINMSRMRPSEHISWN